MRPIPTTICLGLVALSALGHAAEKPKPYHPPRLPDGHVDIEGIWKNSNLTPLERPTGLYPIDYHPGGRGKAQGTVLSRNRRTQSARRPGSSAGRPQYRT